MGKRASRFAALAVVATGATTLAAGCATLAAERAPGHDLAAVERACLASAPGEKECIELRALLHARADVACGEGTLAECLVDLQGERAACAASPLDAACKPAIAAHAQRAGELACVDVHALTCRTACDAGLGRACTALADDELSGEKPDFARGVGDARRACELGDDAACSLALAAARKACLDGKGLERCVALENELQTQCEKGALDACGLADAVEARAAELVCTEGSVAECSASCDGGNLGSCLSLAKIYVKGMRVPVDEARAAKILDRTCKAGDQEACVILGQSYEGTCWNVELCLVLGMDKAKAAAYYDASCAADYVRACQDLASLVVDYHWPLAKDGRARLLDELDAHCSTEDVWTCETLAKRELEAPPAMVLHALRTLCAHGSPDSCGRIRDLGEKP